jgi:hypothetical protein
VRSLAPAGAHANQLPDQIERTIVATKKDLEAVMATAWGPKIYGPTPTNEPHPLDVVASGFSVSSFLANSP